MNEQFKIELQSLLTKYPEVQSVTVKMVQSFEVTTAELQNKIPSPPPPYNVVPVSSPYIGSKIELKPEIASAADATLAAVNNLSLKGLFQPQ